MPLTAGTRLGPYEIVSALGAGGMGEVYRARDPRLGRDVAIKVLHGHVAGNPAGRERFEREARAVASLAHPNIVALFDVGTEGGITFVVTELLEGRTLREHLRDGVPARRALEWAAQIALGLGAAHERGIVHRDLKPENVFVTDEGRVKILDFGLAQVEPPAARTDNPTVLTQVGTFLGTPGYASPEQVSGETATARSDIFALGVILYELVAGRHPFTRPTVVETLTAILREDPPAIGSAPGLPPAVERVVDRCLQKRPADRPASAPDLAFLLQTISAQRETVAGPALEGGPARGTLASVRRPVLLGAPALLLLLTAILWAYVHLTAASAVRQIAEADLERASSFVTGAHRERLARLHVTASVVASFPELRGLLGTDAPTIRDYLVTQQQGLPGTDLLMAFNGQRQLMGRTDTTTPEIDETWLPSLLENPLSVVLLAGRPVHAAVAAGYALDTLVGYIVAASLIDDAFARGMADAVRDDVVLLSDEGVLGSSLRGAQIPWTSLAGWRAAGGSRERAVEVIIGGRRALAREVVLVEPPAVSAVLVSWEETDSAPFRRIEHGIVLIGLLAAAVAALAALRVTRS